MNACTVVVIMVRVLRTRPRVAGDGDMDVLCHTTTGMFGSTNGMNYLFRNEGSGSFGSAEDSGGFGDTFDFTGVVVLADYNRDGVRDGVPTN